MQCHVPGHGSTVWIRHRLWRVERVQRHRNLVRFDVRDRHGRLTFFSPFDRPSLADGGRRPTRVSVRSAAARFAHMLGRTSRVTGLDAVIDATIDVLPHQLEPALAVMTGVRRVLIADDVGLGKTIQAGLVLAELEKRDGTLRALVICPALLKAQWFDELSGRFSLHCLAADRDGIEAAGRQQAAHETPWRRAGVWIGSYDYLKQLHVLEGMPAAPWDVVVIDEAHEASGDTERHDACREIARRARHLVLLTATPHCGDDDRFGRLLDLGRWRDATRVDDDLVVFRRTRGEMGLSSHRRVRWHQVDPSPAERALFDALIAYEKTVLAAAKDRHRASAYLLLTVFRKRALSTTHSLRRSLERRLEWLTAPERVYGLDWMQPPLDFEDVADDVGEDERRALVAEVGLPDADERIWIRRLVTLAGRASAAERKLQRVAALVGRTREPVVIFTEFRDSLEHLERRLGALARLSVVHGGQIETRRRDELRRFMAGDSRVLIATDVAGQGLNLQARARWIVTLELPWNPGRLEQRIGRVDRIGQSRPVHATLLLSRHAVEARIVAGLAKRTMAAQEALGASQLTSVAPPSELTLARMVIGDELHDAGAPAPARVVPSLGWQRRARAVARQLRLRRQLVDQWKHDLVGTRPAACRLRSRSLALRLNGWRLAVFSVPLVDGRGAAVERHLVAIGVAEAVDLRRADTLQSIRDVITRRLEARRRRAQRLVSTTVERQCKGEAGVVGHLHSVCYPEATQVELFNQTVGRSFESDRHLAASLETHLADVERERQPRSTIEVGEPVLELLFLPR